MLTNRARALAIEDSLNKNQSGKPLSRIVSILIILLLVSVAIVGSASAFAGGSGTSDDPYQISNATELQSMKDYLNSYFILNNDIDCSSLSSWTSIGSDSSPFEGHLNGNSKSIKNLTFTVTDYRQGIFGVIKSSKPAIYSCTFDNITRNTNSIIGVSGIIIGDAYNCSINDVTLQNSSFIYKNYQSGIYSCGEGCGGFTGYAFGTTFTNCHVKNTIIDADYFYEVGAISGSYGSFYGCTVENCIISTNLFCVGGFVGRSSDLWNRVIDGNCSVKNCIIKAEKSSTSSSSYGYCIGGFVGYISSPSSSYTYTIKDGATIKNCYIKGTTNESSRGGVGGFIGQITHEYTPSSNSIIIENPNVIGCSVISGENSAGGVIGSTPSGYSSYVSITNPTIANCIITSTSNTASGILGKWST